ncbi:MAG: hypothetical protein ACKVW3_10985 [Phycisphaerales bacterium]
MKSVKCLSAAALVGLAGQALAQPIIDGVRDDSFYGTTPLWVQNQPTGFGDNSATLPCDPNAVNNPGGVTTGVEFRIPLAALGAGASGATVKVMAFITSKFGDFSSNQYLPGLPATQFNLGEPRVIDLSAIAGGIAGNQFVIGAMPAAGAITIDGTRDAGYPAISAAQTARTGFGDANTGTVGPCNGSEADGLYLAFDATNLYVTVTGNLESNGNRVVLFIDSLAGDGQNQLVGTNPTTTAAGSLARMSDDPNTVPIEGMKFDATFSPDRVVFASLEDVGAGLQLFVDFAELPAAGSGNSWFVGTGTAGGGGVLTPGDPGAPAIAVDVNNSNIAGVPGFCPPPTGNPDIANGSEIDGIYLKVANGRLYGLVTGNIQSNYNKISLFFDVASGGQNQLRSDNPNVDFNGLNRLGNDGTGNGLKFDAGFEADYFVSLTTGLNGLTPALFANSAVLRTDGKIVNGNGFSLDYSSFDGGDKPAQAPAIDFNGPLLQPQTGFVPNPECNYAPRGASTELQANPTMPSATGLGGKSLHWLNNSNLGGVSGVDVNDPMATGTVTGAPAVTTGWEFSIDLAELGVPGGNPNSTIKVAGFLSNGGYDFLSNQVVGGIPNTPGRAYAVNLGEPRVVDFSALAGDQFVTLSPGPTCYVNCDGSTSVPFLNVNDFVCFLNRFGAGESYANCDASTTAPILNVNDFICFLNRFGVGCTAP